ncbi:membrane protein, partial [Ralstonia solanacearum]
MTQPSIAIVGAGIAGVACANALAAEGIAATVYERGGGVGGRLATRVLPEGAPTHAFDHGAQSFNVRTEAFRRAVDAARRQGLVMPWPARWGHRTADGLQADTRDEARYVGQPGMSALVRSLATPLDVRLGHAVTRVA